jgi:methionyl-tRNA formyltransferase
MLPRFAFAGDRDIAVLVLDYLLERGCEPVALLVSGPERASHAVELESRLPKLSAACILRGTEFRTPSGQERLRGLELDYIVSIHFPYLVPSPVLSLARLGVLNLHPAFLPYNRGWHTASWAILDGTPFGATLHFMDEGVDTGDIVHQRPLPIEPGDTADSLYRRVKRLELEVFREAWPSLEAGAARRTPQSTDHGRAHAKADLLRQEVRRIDCDAVMKAGDLLRRLRALTTSDPAEAAYFEADGARFRVRVSIEREP